MADAQEKNGSDTDSGPDSSAKTCPVLRASAFTTAGLQPVSSETFGGIRSDHLSHNPFATAGSYASSNNPHADKTTPNRILLRPSVLDQHASTLFKDVGFSTPLKNTSNTFKLDPPKLFSPFSCVKPSKEKDQIENNEKEVDEDQVGEGREETTESIVDANKVSIPKIPAPCKDSSFVFGQKMDDRVVKSPETNNGDTLHPVVASSNASPFVFGSNLADRVVLSTPEKSGDEDAHDEIEQSPPGKESKESTPSASSYSLAESAAIQQAKEDSKVELKQVEVRTGEENESNVFQFNAKLYVFDKSTQTWLERGRGLLRLNDMTADSNRPFQSRLVMRTTGSFRLILNTMIWSGMLVEKASAKSVQISAVDGDEGIKIFLIAATPNDAEQVYSAIISRTQQLKSLESRMQKESAVSIKKRPNEVEVLSNSGKKQKMDPDQRREQVGEESNDSSTPYPETEASNEGFASSPTVQSSSSSSDA